MKKTILSFLLCMLCFAAWPLPWSQPLPPANRWKKRNGLPRFGSPFL
ncbi:MAG: hypothetical protein IKB33_08190 [Spirochaetaceae bacterium]|nr:hypothetical protein [Spirochaetaceae bacterium]